MPFCDAIGFAGATATADTDLLSRDLTVKGTLIAATVRLTIVLTTTDSVFEVIYNDSAGTLVARADVNGGAALVAGQLYSFEFDIAAGQYVNLKAVTTTTATGCMVVLAQR